MAARHAISASHRHTPNPDPKRAVSPRKRPKNSKPPSNRKSLQGRHLTEEQLKEVTAAFEQGKCPARLRKLEAIHRLEGRP